MKIAVRGGHTEKCGGAVALLNELKEDRLVKDAVVKYLKNLGHTVYDVTPPVNYTSDANADLNYGVNKANSLKVDMFVSIHFNKAYSSYEGALGTEVCVYSKFDAAQRVVNSIAKLGFKNRGQKIRTELKELRATTMPSMIVEVCFIEATEDVKLYKAIGPDKIGKVIAEGISNKTVVDKPQDSKPTAQAPKENLVLELQKECNRQGFRDDQGRKLVEDGIKGPATLSALPLLRQGAQGQITKLMQKALINKGQKIDADGIFGPASKKAVEAIQRANKLSVDGIVGKNTWNKLI